MFQTIKLNKEYWSKRIPGLKYGVPDPRKIFSPAAETFSKALTSFNFSGVFKTTQGGRHKLTQSFVKEQIPAGNLPAILDIGASDGSTSLDFIKLLGGAFKKYYVTDYNISCTWIEYKGYHFFFDHKNECFLAASGKFVFYPANKKLFNFLFGKKLEAIAGLPKKELLLVNRELQQLQQQSNGRIQIRLHDVFQPWPLEKTNIVVAGNLLNRAYFTDGQIRTALGNCNQALEEGGLLVIIRNKLNENGTEEERSGIYRKSGSRFIKIHEINGGVEINDLVIT